MADYIELYIDQGADFSSVIAINNDLTNTPQNVAGYVITSQLRRSLLSQNADGRFECSVTDASNGEITFSMTAANTANLRAGSYFFDMTYRDADSLFSANIVTRLLEGVVYIVPGITR